MEQVVVSWLSESLEVLVLFSLVCGYTHMCETSVMHF